MSVGDYNCHIINDVPVKPCMYALGIGAKLKDIGKVVKQSSKHDKTCGCTHCQIRRILESKDN